ncbi:MAG: PAS domain-containing protein, partial [Thermodesulfobacteriota bacterium]
MPESNTPRTDTGPIPEHHLQDVFDNAPIGVFTSTPEGRYISANPALAGMFGYESPEELIASITDIATQVYVDPADREEFIRLMTEHGKVVEHECRFKR